MGLNQLSQSFYWLRRRMDGCVIRFNVAHGRLVRWHKVWMCVHLLSFCMCVVEAGCVFTAPAAPPTFIFNFHLSKTEGFNYSFQNVLKWKDHSLSTWTCFILNSLTCLSEFSSREAHECILIILKPHTGSSFRWVGFNGSWYQPVLRIMENSKITAYLITLFR